MAEAKKAEESESMEEILQSIKKIMDDNTGEKPAAAAEPDVYNLTNVVKDDGTMEEISPTPKAPPTPANAEEVTKSIDSVFSKDAKEAPAAATAAAPPARSADMAEGLMSEYAASAAAKAFQTIADTSQKDYSIPSIPSPQFRGGKTVEDLVIESLKPMLKEWLDKNLPTIVQKIVEKEVKRIVNLHLG